MLTPSTVILLVISVFYDVLCHAVHLFVTPVLLQHRPSKLPYRGDPRWDSDEPKRLRLACSANL